MAADALETTSASFPSYAALTETQAWTSMGAPPIDPRDRAVQLDSQSGRYTEGKVLGIGGMGKVVLDFAGAWSSSSAVGVKMAVGEVTLRLPRRVGVRIMLDTFLASFEPAGLVARDGGYESPGYGEADRRLDIAVTTAVGGVKIEWGE